MAAPTKSELVATVKTLDASIWHQGLTEPKIEEWAEQFGGEVHSKQDEVLAALGLLSRFTFFGIDEVRVLLRNVYTDLFLYRLVRLYRQSNNNSVDEEKIDKFVRRELSATRFVGAGNPAESGAHVLYYFRQVNDLPISQFAAIESLLSESRTALGKVRRVVLLDDLCGSGTSAIKFGKTIVQRLQDRRAEFKQPALEVLYLTVCGTSTGLQKVRESGLYHYSAASLMLDETHMVFSDSSRYFPEGPGAPQICTLTKQQVKAVVLHYGKRLYSRHPLGHENGQLLLGFTHNVPNNTLPIFWAQSSKPDWNAVIRRYGKRYS